MNRETGFEAVKIYQYLLSRINFVYGALNVILKKYIDNLSAIIN